MKFRLAPLDRLELVGEAVALRAGVPLLNGRPLVGWHAQASGQEHDFTVHYHAPDSGAGVFGVEVHNPSMPGEPGLLRYWIAGFPEQLRLDSFGLHFSAVENVRAYLRQGYHSWDGSYYIDPETSGRAAGETPEIQTGFAMTQFLPRSGPLNLVLGFDRHDRFQHTFTFRHNRPLELSVETLWDQKDRRGLERCAGERLLFCAQPEAEAGLRVWAAHVAAASPLPPRLDGHRITGWCSWYNLYSAISEENILEHLQSAARAARREQFSMRVFQIDDGFTPEMGDWLEVKPQFPRGMKTLLDDIRAAGFVPGLWIAPWMVGNRSRLFRDHPDWVVQDRETGGPLVQSAFYGEFRWHKRSEEYYILDITHPQAFAYLSSVFRTWRQEWGCEYFKTDFMFFGSEHGPQRAVWHTPGMTRVEIWRQMAEMIRAEIGDATWLGCGCPLWAPVGLVDGMRIGRDVGVRWQGDFSAIGRLRDTATRNFANGVLWQSDPDVVLLRERFHQLTEAEVRSLALYAGLTGGVLMTSDDLQALSEERLRLWKFLLSLDRGACNFPLLDRHAAVYIRPGEETGNAFEGADPVVVQVRSGIRAGDPEREMEVVFCFNVSEQPVQRTYPLAALGLSGLRHVFEWVSGEAAADPVEALNLLLPPHDGRLFFLSPQPYTA
jgi:hypothetical protein